MGKATRDPATGVTPQMERFACEFAKTGRPSIAYGRAYDVSKMKPGTASREATRLLRDQFVVARIEHYHRIAARALDTSVEALARQTARVAFLDLRDCYDDKGRLLMPHELPTDIAKALDGIDVVEMQGGMKVSLGAGKGEDDEGEEATGEEPGLMHIPIYTKKVRFNRMKAIELLMRWRRMVQDKVDGSADADLSKLTDEEFEKEYRALEETVKAMEAAKGRGRVGVPAKKKQTAKSA